MRLLTPDGPPTPRELEFRAFHADNPQVIDMLERIVEEWMSHGLRHVGTNMVWETLRWRAGLRTTDTEFKINDKYKSRYIRLLLRRRPEWKPYFEIRRLRT